jgi:hypothetical protein
MFNHYLKYCCAIIVILSFQSTSYAQAYKWVDENGQTHFSQRAPTDREADVIKTRPGPKVAPAQSQQAVDDLINKQKSDVKTKEQAKIKQQQKAEQAQIKSKNCDIAKKNLTSYQNKPRGRIKNAEGEYIRVDEIERQNRIKQLKQDIQKHCQ